MEDIVSAILQFFVGVEGKRFWKRVILVTAAILILCLAVEWQLHFFSSIRNKNDVEVLSTLLELEKNGVLDSQNLKTGYLELVESYRRQRRFVILPIGTSAAVFKATSSPQEQLLKFVTGGVVVIVISVAFLLTAKASWGNRMGGFALMTFFGAILGGIATVIPTFHYSLINYIGMPVLQLMALIAIAGATSSRKQKDQEAAQELAEEPTDQGEDTDG